MPVSRRPFALRHQKARRPSTIRTVLSVAAQKAGPRLRRRGLKVECLLSALLLIAAGSVGAEAIDLSPRSPAERSRVSIEWQLAGELQLPPPPDTVPLASNTAPQVRVAAQLTFDQQRLDSPVNQGRYARHYHQVDTTVAVEKQVRQRSLRDDRRLLLATSTPAGPQLLGVEGPLSRDEFDTVQLPADVMSLPALLPTTPVAPGDTWQHSAEVMGAFTLLQQIEICEVQSLLVEANSRYAKCQMAGTVHGTIDGTRSEMEVDAVYLVDRERGEITRLNVALREKREVGPVTPGLTGIVKLRLTVEPDAADDLTPAMALRVARAYPVPARALETSSDQLGFRVTHDKSWYVTGTRGNTITLRKVDGTNLVAHATLTRLPPKRLDPERSLAEFRADVADTIGKPLAGIASDQQFTNEHGCRVMHVVGQGSVEGVPVEWHAYQVAPPEDRPDGERLALTFVIEASQLETLGDDDRQLVERIELVERTREIAAEKNSGAR